MCVLRGCELRGYGLSSLTGSHRFSKNRVLLLNKKNPAIFQIYLNFHKLERYWFWSLTISCSKMLQLNNRYFWDQEETINQNFGSRPTVEEEQPMCCVTLSKTWHQKSITLPRQKLRARYCSVFVPRFPWNIVPVPLDRWVFLFKRPRRSVQNSEHLPKYI